MKRLLSALAIASTLAGVLTTPASAQEPIKILHMYPGTGPFEAYGKNLQRAFLLGLEYATQGKMEINGRKIVVIEKDTQNRADFAKSMLTQGYQDDKVDLAVGAGASAQA